MPDRGQVVEIRVAGLTYLSHLVRADGALIYVAEWTSPEGHYHEVILPSAVTKFVSTVPGSWPPRAGDLWAGGDSLYFFYFDSISGVLNVRNQRGDFLDGRGSESPIEWLLRRHTKDGEISLRLVYRDPQEP